MIRLFLISLLSINLFAINLELSGVVESSNEKIITSRNMGYIKKVYVDEGDEVKKGTILYEIDSSNMDSSRQEVLLNMQILQSQASNLALNLKRYKNLLDQDLVSKYEYEQLELNLSNVKNMLSITKAKQKEVDEQYNYLKVKATNDGLIIKKSIKEGEMAMPGMPHMILTDLDSLIIKSSISESNLKDIKINQEVDIEIPSISFITKGKVSAVIPNTVGLTHSFVLKITFDKKDSTLYSGMYAKVNINLSDGKKDE